MLGIKKKNWVLDMYVSVSVGMSMCMSVKHVHKTVSNPCWGGGVLTRRLIGIKYFALQNKNTEITLVPAQGQFRMTKTTFSSFVSSINFEDCCFFLPRARILKRF
jgi:hypothetical protein